MTDDIVTRLRSGQGDDIVLFKMMDEAADEIERLREKVKRLTTAPRFVDEVYILTKEGEELWDKIRAVRGE